MSAAVGEGTVSMNICQGSPIHAGIGGIDDVSEATMHQLIMVGLLLTSEGKHWETFCNYLKRKSSGSP